MNIYQRYPYHARDRHRRGMFGVEVCDEYGDCYVDPSGGGDTTPEVDPETGLPLTHGLPTSGHPGDFGGEAGPIDVITKGGTDIAALSRVLLSAAQISAGVAKGQLAASAKCPSGYMTSNGICTIPAGTKATPMGQWFPGITNNSVLMIGGGILAAAVLISVMKGGGRRR